MVQTNRGRRNSGWDYRIDREALSDFIARQVALVEAAPIPKLLGDVVELRLRHESVSRDEVQALWLGAGLATPDRVARKKNETPQVAGLS